jgi:hypothetical protein
VPAAAVIPAPKAYIKVVAVKTSVVEFTPGIGPASSSLSWIGGQSGDKVWLIEWLASAGCFSSPGVLP